MFRREDLTITVFLNRRIRKQLCPECRHDKLYLARVKDVRFFTSLYCMVCQRFGQFEAAKKGPFPYCCGICQKSQPEYRSKLRIAAAPSLIFSAEACSECKEMIPTLPVEFGTFLKSRCPSESDYHYTKQDFIAIFNRVLAGVYVHRRILHLTPTLIDFDVRVSGGKATGLKLADGESGYCGLCGEFGRHPVETIQGSYICGDCYRGIKRDYSIRRLGK